MDDFDDRVARLEEHIVDEHMTAEDHLARAEAYLARGPEWQRLAGISLGLAKLERELDEAEEDDDDPF